MQEKNNSPFVSNGYMYEGFKHWEIQISKDGSAARYRVTHKGAQRDTVYLGRWQEIKWSSDGRRGSSSYIVARYAHTYRRLYFCCFIKKWPHLAGLKRY